MLIKKQNNTYTIKLNKEIYNIDHIISILTKHKEFENSLNLGFSNISDDKYIKITLTPKSTYNLKLLNEMLI
jgi:hypothetical protein